MSESGRIKAVNNVKAFEKFIKLHTEQGDWYKYLNRSKVKLIRLKICEECGFSRSALSQNPKIKEMLNELEIDLLNKGILSKNYFLEENLIHIDKIEFVESFGEKLMKLKNDTEKVEKTIAFYQSELEKLNGNLI